MPMKLVEKNALPGDQYGHVLSACLGGSHEDVNMYPQNEEVRSNALSARIGEIVHMNCKMMNRKINKLHQKYLDKSGYGTF